MGTNTPAVPVSDATRRWFGVSAGVATWLLGTVSTGASSVGLFLSTLVGLLIAIVYYVKPPWQIAFIEAWKRMFFPLRFLAGHMFFCVIFCGLVIPIGILRRMLRPRSSAWADTKNDAASTWEPTETPRDLKRYLQQF
ncbi:MAG: hypothetical protein AAGD07_08240 [Planctomycetota bacterium]